MFRIKVQRHGNCADSNAQSEYMARLCMFSRSAERSWEQKAMEVTQTSQNTLSVWRIFGPGYRSPMAAKIVLILGVVVIQFVIC